MLPWPAAPPWSAGTWAANPDQRANAQGPQKDGGWARPAAWGQEKVEAVRCRLLDQSVWQLIAGTMEVKWDEKDIRRSTRKVKRNVPYGQVHIYATFNNTIITITDQQGNALAWGSAGAAGFKGSRKSTPYAARLAAQQAIKQAQDMGMQEVDVFVKGPGPGREAAIRAVQAAGIKVRSITDVTPVPHNGCRPPKEAQSIVIGNILRGMKGSQPVNLITRFKEKLNWQDIQVLRVNYAAEREKSSFSKALAVFPPNVLWNGASIRLVPTAGMLNGGAGVPLTTLASCERSKRHAGFMAYWNGSFDATSVWLNSGLV